MPENTACLRCGSTKIIPDVPLRDHIGDLGMRSVSVDVTVDGAPEAFIFKDSASGSVSIDICGACGHAELRVSDFQDLYEKYEKSTKA